jgi:N-ATPase, AtpR subunit
MIADAGFLAAGAAAGVMFFWLLRWNTTLYLGGERVAMGAALHVVRLGALAGLLVLTARCGALPLLLTALGLLIVRPLVTLWIASAS